MKPIVHPSWDSAPRIPRRSVDPIRALTWLIGVPLVCGGFGYGVYLLARWVWRMV